MGVELDHLLWAAPDLDAGTATLAALTGVTPGGGGAHPGHGTRNNLAGLGGRHYIEVISPDPVQPLVGNRGGAIAALPQPGLMTFAVRTDDLEAYRAAAREVGVATRGPIAMGRTRPDGVRLDWACLYPDHAAYGELIPFAIDWMGSPHPSATVPRGLRLVDFAVLHPDPDPLRRIFAALGVAVAVKRGSRPGLVATLETPLGEVVLLGP